MTQRTRKNVTAALQCDAVDSAKYQRFAARARMDDDWELAKAFQDAADADRSEHFCKEAQLQGLIADSPENLRRAIDAEAQEAETFAQFAREAAEDGDRAAANIFEQIGKDKAEICARFEDVLAQMGVHSDVRAVSQ